ncbi:uroporphyrinogen-III C-methyltransferase [Niallia sp. NCCP-28]|uniref:uroporphyrinogen-III C-methyltransferase n=1 Tax=Niallia sp. NCCP-28 TaxID=2934712 RepID=UPI00208732B2|nr:uroporphyrinogen-III C-methyltransferase [Niallia sp. NCCP-28]GKU81957.1 bifunctional uroporphyrinogen III methyltransferase/uroporphyrinogen III methyltransferase [Niallia sp. NCCP-28]
MKTNKGHVAFVGAGPGDIGLITQKGLECLSKADVVLYDRLANPRLLRYTKNHCEFVYCGKLPNNHIMRQEKINESLIYYALKGKYVVRLKGGDPSVFGRVGEEAEAVAKQAIPFEIVPGITASIAASAYAGIPVTHRECSNSFTIRTGHFCENNHKLNYDKNTGDTIAYYMGVKGLGTICQELIEQGKSKETKAAVIQWGTLGKQKVVEGTLATIVSLVEKENITNPALTIVGDVVNLRSSIAWFEKLPFYQKRIIIAKSSAGESQLEKYFSDNGAEVFAFPALKKVDRVLHPTEIEAIKEKERLIFFAPESMEVFFSQFYQHGYDLRDLPKQIEYVSEKTKKALAEKRIRGQQAIFQQKDACIIGPSAVESSNQYAPKNIFIISHEIKIDFRFDEMNRRLLSEDQWQTVIFPNKSAIDYFLKEWERFSADNPTKLMFAYIGESVKEYAMEKGFHLIDEAVQQALETKDWKVE